MTRIERPAAGLPATPGDQREPATRATADAGSDVERPASEGAPSDGVAAGPVKTPDVVRQLVALVANVTVLTALLVYFGWQRSETQAALLGVDESVFGMGTRDYVLRSVGPVLRLLAVIGVGGLAAFFADRALTRWARRRGATDRLVRASQVLLSFAWLILPVLAVGLGYAWPDGAYIFFPLSIGAGVLLLLYRTHLHGQLGPVESAPAGRALLQRASVALLVAISLFWATSRYAEVVGGNLADSFGEGVHDLASVVVYSPQRLDITAPGTREDRLPAADSAYRYRYGGLRLWGHLGGHYFFVSDDWTPAYGVVVMLPDGAPVRLEFVHDERR